MWEYHGNHAVSAFHELVRLGWSVLRPRKFQTWRNRRAYCSPEDFKAILTSRGLTITAANMKET